MLVLALLLAPAASAAAQDSTGSATTLYLPIVSYQVPPPAVTQLGPEGGTFPGVAVNPADPNVIYAGSYGAGAYKSEDAGLTWQAINNGLTNRFIQSMAVTPDGSTVYAGTYGGGIFRSQDGGASWQAINNQVVGNFIVYDIEIDPNNPQKVYLSGRTQGTFENGGYLDGHVYFSADGGNAWQEIWSGYSISGLGDYGYDVDVTPDGNTLILAVHQHGVWRREGNGTWIKTQDDANYDMTARNVAIDRLAPQYVYSNLYNSVGVLRSSNYGMIGNWTLLKNNLPGNANYAFALETDPATPSTLYLGTMRAGVFKSSDRGENWTSKGLFGTFVWRFSLTSANPQQIVAGTAGNGVQVSTNGGDTWEWRAAGIYNTTVSALAVLPSQPGTIYAGTDGAGIYRTSDAGQSWERVSNGLADLNVKTLRVIDGKMYAVTGSDLYTSSDGVNWSAEVTMAPSLETTPQVEGGDPFSYLSIQPEEEELLKSASLMPDVAGEASSALGSGRPITALEKTAQGLWLGTDGAGIFLTGSSCHTNPTQTVYALHEHQGVLWTSIDNVDKYDNYKLKYYVARLNGECQWDTRMAGIDTLTKVNDFATVGTRLFALSTKGIYIYVPGTYEYWYPANGLNSPAYALAEDPNTAGLIYAATETGAYYSLDNGSNWQAVPRGELQNIALVSLLFDPQNPNIVYFGSRDGSTYRWDKTVP